MTNKAYVWIESINLKRGVASILTSDAPDPYVKIQSCNDYTCRSPTDLVSTPKITNAREDPYVIPRYWSKFNGDVYHITTPSVNDRFQFTVKDSDWGPDDLIGTTYNWKLTQWIQWSSYGMADQEDILNSRVTGNKVGKLKV